MYVRVAEGSGGGRDLPSPANVSVVVTSEDSEDHATTLRQPIAGPGPRTLVTYVKPGRKGGDVRVHLETEDAVPRREFGPPLPPSTEMPPVSVEIFCTLLALISASEFAPPLRTVIEPANIV